LPPPSGDSTEPLQALIFDSHYDPFRGTIVHFRIFQGEIQAGDTIMFMSNKSTYKVEEVGIFQINRIPQKKLSAGQVGYIIAGIKTVSDTRCGDTITLKDRPCKTPMTGFKEFKPVVFSSIYPMASTMHPCSTKRTLPRPLGLVFVADSSVYFTLKSFRSVLRGNTIFP
jgi:GTP-binding protein LepA